MLLRNTVESPMCNKVHFEEGIIPMKTIIRFLKTTFSVSLLIVASSAHANINGAPVQAVRAVSDGNVEYVLANLFGQSLYTFAPDPIDGTPVCNDTCAEVWPPFLISDEEALNLLAPFSTVTRANGKKQLAREGKALYTYFLDRKAGDILGDGINDAWFDIHLDIGSVGGCAINQFALNESRDVKISTAGMAYSPKCLQIKKGTKVTFPASSVHPLSALKEVLNFKNPLITPTPKTAPITLEFNSTGVFGYFCVNHGSANGSGMAGAIEVIE